METIEKCIDKVQDKFNEREKDFLNAKEYFDKYEDATEGGKIALAVFNEEYKDYYEDFFDYINQYGLGFDYVEKGTFEDQERGYFRYQLSWGGPSDEFRIFVDWDGSIDFIEYWLLDWWDGANITISEDSLSYEICSWFLELSDVHGILEDENTNTKEAYMF
tara:strand:- start:309 stop:794 length:486 start_codon:yes stop_codon:yes gene_type:complete